MSSFMWVFRRETNEEEESEGRGRKSSRRRSGLL